MTADLRVLMITSEWPNTGHPERGRFIVQQVEFLRRAGVEVEVFPFRGAMNPLNYLRAWRQAQSRLRRGSFDFVHAQFGQSGILACVPKRRPLVVTYRGDDLEGIVSSNGRYTRSGQMLRLISRLVALRADAVIVVSQHLKRYLTRRDCFVIPSGLDLDLFRPLPQIEARRCLGWQLDGRLVLFVGDPDETRKRYTLAQQAVALTGIANLVVAWGVAHDLIPLYMNACDALVLTSMHEGSPNAVKEALACNLPVVSVDVGDVRQRLAGVEGCVVCADDRPETIAMALRLTLERGQRIAGRVAVHDLDERLLTQRVVRIYHAVLNRTGAQLRNSGADIQYHSLQPYHGREVAQIHIQSFLGGFLTCLGERALTRFYQWFAGKPDALAFVAMQEGQAVGFVVGWYPAYGWAGPLMRDLKWILFLGVGRGLLFTPRVMLAHLWQRRQAFLGWAQRYHSTGRQSTLLGSAQSIKRASLDSIAVSPVYRGTGIADGLQAEFVTEARRRGIHVLSLSVEVDNSRARAFYEKHGWRLFQESETIAKYRFDVLPPRSEASPNVVSSAGKVG